jgi:hypothetical protein
MCEKVLRLENTIHAFISDQTEQNNASMNTFNSHMVNFLLHHHASNMENPSSVTVANVSENSTVETRIAGNPSDPAAPVTPLTLTDPTDPVQPFAPLAPVTPVTPVIPLTPTDPH